MRSFKVVPTEPGVHAHHLWAVIAVAENGTESVAATYETKKEAEAAKAILDRQEADIRS